jgi:(p)ppGpp synthase/HD superfamily hydrolase
MTTTITEAGSLERAIEIAVQAHAGVTDKAGAPYVLHPLRVMLSMDSDPARITAVLHDVLEDSRDWSVDRLKAEGFGRDILEALESVTKRADEEPHAGATNEEKSDCYLRFVRRAAAHPIGRLVKKADLEDNLDVRRLKVITEKDAQRISRYLVARALLS